MDSTEQENELSGQANDNKALRITQNARVHVNSVDVFHDFVDKLKRTVSLYAHVHEEDPSRKNKLASAYRVVLFNKPQDHSDYLE